MIMTEVKSWQITSHPHSTPPKKKTTCKIGQKSLCKPRAANNEWKSLYSWKAVRTLEKIQGIFFSRTCPQHAPPLPPHGWYSADHGSWGSRHGVCCPDPWQMPSELNGVVSKAALERAFSSAVLRLQAHWGCPWSCHVTYRETAVMESLRRGSQSLGRGSQALPFTLADHGLRAHTEQPGGHDGKQMPKVTGKLSVLPQCSRAQHCPLCRGWESYASVTNPWVTMEGYGHRSNPQSQAKMPQ